MIKIIPNRMLIKSASGVFSGLFEHPAKEATGESTAYAPTQADERLLLNVP
jgi:hypothetical protein